MELSHGHVTCFGSNWKCYVSFLCGGIYWTVPHTIHSAASPFHIDEEILVTRMSKTFLQIPMPGILHVKNKPLLSWIPEIWDLFLTKTLTSPSNKWFTKHGFSCTLTHIYFFVLICVFASVVINLGYFSYVSILFIEL